MNDEKRQFEIFLLMDRIMNDVTTAFASDVFANANIEALQERKIKTRRAHHKFEF